MRTQRLSNVLGLKWVTLKLLNFEQKKSRGHIHRKEGQGMQEEGKI